MPLPLRYFIAFLDHALEVDGHDLEAHVARHDRADLLDQRPERPLLLGDQRRVGGDAVDHADGHAFLDLCHVRGVEKDLHRVLPRKFAQLRSMTTRAPDFTRLKVVASPVTRPTTLTGLAGR